MIGRWIFLRDGRLSGRSKLVLAAIFVIALIATFPLRLVLGLADPGGRWQRFGQRQLAPGAKMRVGP